MNFEFFIANRILKKGKANFSKPIVRLGILSVALGLSVMIVSISIVTGFQQQVRNKVIGFGADIRISGFETSTSYEALPININQPFYTGDEKFEGVNHIQVYAMKAGIIKTGEQIEGVIFKGIAPDFDWSFFTDKMVEGRPLMLSDTATGNNVLISKSLANRLQLNLGDPLRMYFLIPDEIQPRGRKFTITGIYETGLEEFDKLYVIGDINHIRKLNGWSNEQVGGFELFIDNYDKLDDIGKEVYSMIGYDLKSETIKDIYPQIFEWLSLHDMNVIILIALMIMVAGITMISTLLILILEKTNMIGTLKALGARNRSIRQIFLLNAVYIIGKGMLWGNAIALGLSLLQLQFGFFKLDQESYYVSEVPINLNIWYYLATNIGTLVICTLMLIIPTYIVTRISPVKAIRYA
ncbi:MAG: ABC transporter permease [Bacteroidales bacterium]|nr:ABC transporter permease [Bacteroidales bacterium]